MSTYYGYAEREAEDNINWSTVGNDITKMLKEEVERRETLKKDIDKATRDYGETLANAPTGTHKGANDFITRFSDDATQAMLMQDRLLKSGQLKVKDYLLQRANLKDGTKNIFGVAKKFQAEVKRRTSRMNDTDSALLEQTLFKLTEGFANFNNTGAYINPTNYSVSLAKKERVQDKDGNYVYQMSKEPQDFFTLSELNAFVSVDINRFKTKEALDEIAKAAGARDQTITYRDDVDGQFKTVTISDVTGELLKKLPADQRKLVDSYQDAIDSEINYILANKYNAASILTDYIGKGYDFEFDPKKAAKDEKMILLEKDPSGSGIPKVVISPEQEAVIREELEKGIKFRLKQAYTEKGTQIREYNNTDKPETDRERKNRQARNQGIRAAARIKEFIRGDKLLKMEDLQFFRNKAEGNVYGLGIREDNNGVVGFYIEKKKGQYTPIVKDINNKDPQEIAEQILASGHFNFFDAGLSGRYSIINNLSKTITKDLKLQPFEKDDNGKYPYIEIEIDQTVGQQANQSGVKQTASGSYRSIIDKKKGTAGSLSDQNSSNAVSSALKNSYFTASVGGVENIFNPNNIIVETIPTKKAVASSYKDLDTTLLPSAITDPEADYQAILIRPGKNKNFMPVLLPVAEDYNIDFNKVMDRIAEQMEGGSSYDVADIYALFENPDDTLKAYLEAGKAGKTNTTTTIDYGKK